MRNAISTLPAVPVDVRDLQLPIPVKPRPPRSRRVRAWLRGHRAAAAWLTPLLALAGVVHAVGMSRSPGFTDVEGRVVAQIAEGDWSLPADAGAAQLAAWIVPTGALGRADHALAAGREAMLVVLLVSVALLWVLARRLSASRPAAAVAVVIFVLSPLAVHLHRMVLVDNLAMAWIFAAFVLATTRRRPAVTFAAAAVTLAIAVVTQPTFLLFATFVVWSMRQQAGPELYRRLLGVAAVVVALGGYAYLLVSLVGRQPLPGEEGLARWWDLDPVLLTLAPLVALAAMAFIRLRPLAGALILVVLLMGVPARSTPVSLAVAVAALTAILAPAIVRQLLSLLPRVRLPRLKLLGVPRGAAKVALGLAAVAMVGVPAVAAAATWPGELRTLLRDDSVAPITQAERWLAANLERDASLVVDETLRTDLLRLGFTTEGVVAFTDFPPAPRPEDQLDLGPTGLAPAGPAGQLDQATQGGPTGEETARPRGWPHYDYIVSTASMRSDVQKRPDVVTATAESSVVATFGSAAERIEIRAIHPLGLEAAEALADADRRIVRYATQQLLENDALDFEADATATATQGRMDPRIALVLGKLAGTHRLAVSLPPMPGEDSGVHRRVVLAGLPSDVEAARLGLWLLGQQQPFTPAAVEVEGTEVTATYSLVAPRGLLPDPPQ